MLIQGKLLTYGNDLSDVYFIHRKVFIDERKLPETVESDEQDVMSMHVIVYEETGCKRAVATGRISFDGEYCEIGYIAVLKEFRNKKYGDFTVRMLLNKAFTSDIHIVKAMVNSESIGFFEKIGFHIIGDRIINENQAYYLMEIKPEDIKTLCHKAT